MTGRDGNPRFEISNLKSWILFASLFLGGCQSISTRVAETEPPAAAESAANPRTALPTVGASPLVPDDFSTLGRFVLFGPNQFLGPPPFWLLPRSDQPVLPLPKESRPSNVFVVSPYALGAGGSQPLAANLRRLNDWFKTNGYPAIPVDFSTNLATGLNQHVVFKLKLERDGTLHVERGDASVELQQYGTVPLLVRLENVLGLKGSLTVTSSLAGPVYGGGAINSLTRQGRPELRSEPENESHPERTFDVELHRDRNSPQLASGLEVEYGLLLATPHAVGKHDVPLQFRFTPEGAATPATAEFTLPCDVKPAVQVTLIVREQDDSPTIGKFTFVDSHGQVHPSMPKRLAPDLFFQRHVYRADGETIALPPGMYDVHYSRGPEYQMKRTTVIVPDAVESQERFNLRRWVDPRSHGFYSGDHHIHGAGCAHYTSPTEGVSPADMFRQVKGEGLNVGSVLTWGPCYDYQRRYFSADADAVSEPLTLLKYDVEVSGFGSQKLGHVCLLNLRDQTYPGSNGTTQGWPTWTIPVLRWAKQQGGVTGFAHSASGMYVLPEAQSLRLTKQLDANRNDIVDREEALGALLPEPFAVVDADHNGRASLVELEASHRRAAESLPNFAVPELNGPGAMEICVAAAEGVCDFISSMDTARIQEWTIWYHLLNCGLPIATAGETDFPCMSGTRVGQGRTYVQLGIGDDKLNYADWCRGLAAGHSYVSDGYAHALDFAVDDKRYGELVGLSEPREVTVTTVVAFSSETPTGVKHGIVPPAGPSRVGDTVVHYPETEDARQTAERLVEVVVNGAVVARQKVPADDRPHTLSFPVRIEQSSWVAIRHFPQLHTNPIRVIVAGRPIRASRRSAEWCVAVIEQLWKNRAVAISETERPAAAAAYEEAKKFYRRLAAECRAEQLR